MPVSCDPQDLITQFGCLQCVPNGMMAYARLQLLCQWAGSITPARTIIIIADGAGGFWELVVDTIGNVGAESAAGPATSPVILADGSGGFWQIIVDPSGLRGTQPSAGPATVPPPTLTDSSGGLWELVVDTLGNLGANSLQPFSYAPAGAVITWSDSGGGHAGNLATFNATADIPSVFLLNVNGLGLTSIVGLHQFPLLNNFDCGGCSLTDLDVSLNPLLTLFVVTVNAGITAVNVATNPALMTVQMGFCSLTQDAVNAILIALDGFGTLNGTVTLNNQTPPAPPSGAGIAAAASLVGKGWAVTTD